MAADWPRVRLGEFVRFRKGVSYKGSYLDQPGPLLLGLGTIVPGGGVRLDAARPYGGPIKCWQRIAPGELFVALTDITQDGRVLGSPALVPPGASDEFAVTHHVARAEVLRTDALAPRFLYYVMQSTHFREYMSGVATGTTVRSVSIKDAEAYLSGLPTLAEQEGIAHILGALDGKIDLNRRMSETLEGMERALFKSWFVDFEPVRANAESRGPGMPSSVAGLFPASLKGSELGDIPSGWSVRGLEDVAENPRRTVSADEIEPTSPYIGLEHMPRKSIALTQWATAKGLESGKFKHNRGDILFGKLRPYFHKVGIAPVDGVCSTDIVVVTPGGTLVRLRARTHVERRVRRLRRRRIHGHQDAAHELGRDGSVCRPSTTRRHRRGVHSGDSTHHGAHSCGHTRIEHPRHPTRHVAAEADLGRTASTRRRTHGSGGRHIVGQGSSAFRRVVLDRKLANASVVNRLEPRARAAITNYLFHSVPPFDDQLQGLPIVEIPFPSDPEDSQSCRREGSKLRWLGSDPLVAADDDQAHASDYRHPDRV